MWTTRRKLAAPETLGRVQAPGPLSWLFSPLFKDAEGAEAPLLLLQLSRVHIELCVVFSLRFCLFVLLGYG